MQDSGLKLNDSLSQKENTMNEVLEQPAATIQKAVAMTEPKFSSITDFAIQRRVGGPWYKVDVNMVEALQILQTGEFDENPITAIRILEVNSGNENGDEIHFIYDFTLLHTERNPWRMV